MYDYVSEAGYGDGMSSSDELVPTPVPFLTPEQSWDGPDLNLLQRNLRNAT